MVIDSTHRNWIAAALILLTVASVAYVPYALEAPQGPSGGSIPGLVYGIAGFGLMVFAGLLSFRRKVPVRRIGRVQTWMRGHLWLGLISLPLILFHAGFHFGGPLTQVLMWLLTAVVISGVLGAALQHYLPRIMQRELPMETVYEQIGHIREQLRAEAEDLVSAPRKDPRSAGGPPPSVGKSGETGGAAAALEVTTGEDRYAPLRAFYEKQVRPFLAGESSRTHPMGDPEQAVALFAHIRLVVEQDIRERVDDLENICEEERQLRRQERLHVALHGWLFVHVPLSFALLALGVLHAVLALRY